MTKIRLGYILYKIFIENFRGSVFLHKHCHGNNKKNVSTKIYTDTKYSRILKELMALLISRWTYDILWCLCHIYELSHCYWTLYEWRD